MSFRSLRLSLAACAGLAATAAGADLTALPLKTIEGKDVTLKAYAGKVLLIVNVASECGYTGQYAGLQALQARYAAKGFTVLGFPCNDFGGQEPAGEAEIQAFCTSRYQVSFPLFAKVRLAGPDKHPLFAALTAAGGEVQWNFEKFLVGRDGALLSRFDSAAEPEGGEIEAAIRRALGD